MNKIFVFKFNFSQIKLIEFGKNINTWLHHFSQIGHAIFIRFNEIYALVPVHISH